VQRRRGHVQGRLSVGRRHDHFGAPRPNASSRSLS
jgi:hypothetical protein